MREKLGNGKPCGGEILSARVRTGSANDLV
jgi:hypothetical protein